MMLGTERFIATAIRFVRIEPDAPTIVPATINAKLSNAIPAAAAERPVNAFNRLMTTGMSAPPIGNTTMFPKIAAATRMPRTNNSSECSPAVIATAEPDTDQQQHEVQHLLARHLDRRPGRISWSFANAIFLPQNEMEPMIAANNDAIITVSSHATPVSPVN